MTDVDNDGDLAVFWACGETFYDRFVSWRENDGTGNFSAPEFIETGLAGQLSFEMEGGIGLPDSKLVSTGQRISTFCTEKGPKHYGF